MFINYMFFNDLSEEIKILWIHPNTIVLNNNDTEKNELTISSYREISFNRHQKRTLETRLGLKVWDNS